ncbi:MAG: transaldolase [Actinobacteria bacterium]|nr:transaldolase [Actinomycetota bacterium]MCL5447383.1 transaldolase [Actinomycetota bacterium]
MSNESRTRLQRLYDNCGQSPWLDNLRRDYLHNGHLEELIASGIRGVTSNPTIFAKAIEDHSDYDTQFMDLLSTHSVTDACWELIFTDISEALGQFAPLFISSKGSDGFVSMEVDPALAFDTYSTLKAAIEIHERLNSRNLLVKIPATAEGLPAIERAVSLGLNVNVTLIFGLKRYEQVIDAYINGIEALVKTNPTRVPRVSSVASFFVSRMDTEVDKRLDRLAEDAKRDGKPDSLVKEISSLRGKTAVSQARQAYRLFQDRFKCERFFALEKLGAKPQRPLWASTSTKNPAYPDLLYVDNLIAEMTVNTMPDATVDAFLDHGHPVTTISTVSEEDDRLDERIAEVGIDVDDVASTLERQGVNSFMSSFTELVDTLSNKAEQLSGKSHTRTHTR